MERTETSPVFVAVKPWAVQQEATVPDASNPLYKAAERNLWRWNCKLLHSPVGVTIRCRLFEVVGQCTGM